MNELQPHFSGTSDSSDQSTDGNIVPHTTDKNDQKAQVLESLLQELSFWEPSTSLVTTENGDGKMRKSRSVNDVGRDEELIRNRNHHGLTNSTSYSGGTCGGNVQNFLETDQQQRDSIPRRDREWDSSTSRNNSAHTDSSTIYTNVHLNDDGTTANTAETPGSPTLTELQARCCWNKAIDPTTGRTYYYDIRTRQTQWEKVKIDSFFYFCIIYTISAHASRINLLLLPHSVEMIFIFYCISHERFALLKSE
jgi:hypothetical protein